MQCKHGEIGGFCHYSPKFPDFNPFCHFEMAKPLIYPITDGYLSKINFSDI